MKKVKMFLMAALAIASMTIVGCSSCNRDVEPETLTSLDFESIIRADYESMCGNIDTIAEGTSDGVMFYEAQVWYDTVLTADSVTPNIVKIVTVFQHMDTCTQIYHMLVDGVMVDSVDVVNDFWCEDMPTVPYNAVSLDSAIVCAKNANIMPDTKFVVMRRPLYPPFPRENYYIFGNIVSSACIDAEDGHVVEEY